jgi:hypothetical protein
MRLRHVWLPLAALLGILTYMAWPKAAQSLSASAATASSPVEYSPGTVMPDLEASSSATSAAPSAAAKVPAFKTATASLPLVDSIPSKDDLRKDVALDPHATPQGLLKFSVVLFQKQKAAKADGGVAKAFFEELQSCALAHESAQSVQVLCLLNAKRLAKQYSSLENGMRDLETRADTAAVTQMQHMPL